MVFIFSIIKGRLINDPERSLTEAYQIAVKIQNWEQRFLVAKRSREGINGSQNDTAYLIEKDMQKNVVLLEHKIREFRASQGNLNNLSYERVEKLLFIEGVAAKYKLNSDLAAVNPAKVQSSLISPTILPQLPIDLSMGSTPPTPVEERDESETFSGKPKILPRSIGKTIDKIRRDFTPNAEKKVVSDFYRSRTRTLIASRVLLMLIVIPLLTQFLAKNLIVMPMVSEFRGESESQIFLHSEMKEEALKEIQIFEQELKLESLLSHTPVISPEIKEEKIKEKVAEIAAEFRHKSNSAISNVFADVFGLIAFGLVVFFRRQDIQVLKSFIDNLVYGLSDAAKAFAIILLTDIFVGFHSPHGWEVLLESMASHLGVPANKSAIALFIATVPVLMDTIFKYWIFLSLSRMSPSTVSTLKGMNE
jgi:hypothetical protein